jgi:hypothetical protein
LGNKKTNSESIPTTTTLSNEVNNREDLLFYIFVGIFGFLLILISSFTFFTYLYRRKKYSFISLQLDPIL